MILIESFCTMTQIIPDPGVVIGPGVVYIERTYTAQNETAADRISVLE